MPQRTAMIGSLPEAFGVVKAMRAGSPDWGTGCRQAVPQVPAGITQGRMMKDVDLWLGSPESSGGGDRRNGTCRRRLPCELGDIGPAGPRTRRHCPTAVLGSRAHRARETDRVILAGFVPATRRIGEVLLLPLLRRSVPPATVSRGTGTLDTAIAAFHRRQKKRTRVRGHHTAAEPHCHAAVFHWKAQTTPTIYSVGIKELFLTWITIWYQKNYSTFRTPSHFPGEISGLAPQWVARAAALGRD